MLHITRKNCSWHFLFYQLSLEYYFLLYRSVFNISKWILSLLTDSIVSVTYFIFGWCGNWFSFFPICYAFNYSPNFTFIFFRGFKHVFIVYLFWYCFDFLSLFLYFLCSWTIFWLLKLFLQRFLYNFCLKLVLKQLNIQDKLNNKIYITRWLYISYCLICLVYLVLCYIEPI